MTSIKSGFLDNEIVEIKYKYALVQVICFGAVPYLVKLCEVTV